MSPDFAPIVVESIGAWYRANARDLPWRAPDLSPWQILLSEVMAQQTPVARVVPIWHRWLELWPAPADLAAAPTDQVLREWKNLGYPRRALRLQECAAVVAKRYNGVVPATYEELIDLPGVGEYTAGAILAFAYGKRALVLDTNVRRIIARIFLGEQFPGPSFTAAEKKFAATLIPDTDEGGALWAQSSMELGATLCTARVVQCDLCPVAQLCKWRADGFPPDQHGEARKPQKFTGTDRQVRGLIMKELRGATGPIGRSVLDLVWSNPDQLERCINSLVTDGLLAIQEDYFVFPS